MLAIEGASSRVSWPASQDAVMSWSVEALQEQGTTVSAIYILVRIIAAETLGLLKP
jgi:hypothetical protein